MESQFSSLHPHSIRILWATANSRRGPVRRSVPVAKRRTPVGYDRFWRGQRHYDDSYNYYSSWFCHSGGKRPLDSLLEAEEDVFQVAQGVT